LGPQYAASRHTTPQSTTLGLHPVIHVPNYMDHYSFTDLWGMDGWVGWPIADGLTTNWSPIQIAVWPGYGKFASRDSVLPTMLCHQQVINCKYKLNIHLQMLRLSIRRYLNRPRLSTCRSLFSANEPNNKHKIKEWLKLLRKYIFLQYTYS